MYSRNDKVIEQSVENVSGALLPISGTTLEYTDIPVTEEAGYISRYGILETGNNWKHAEVDVEGGATYFFTGSSASKANALYVFDNYHLIKTILETAGTGTYAQTVVMPANAKRIIINKSTSGIALKKATSLLFSANNDWLNGKKLYCGGDSITEGANVGTLPNGYKKTYGGYTATRNGMTYVSDGVGGSTMGKCTIDGSVHNNFITSRYKNIPTDANFITLWFGWNDNAYGWKSARDAYCVTQYGTYYSALTSAQQAEVDAYKTWLQWIDVYVGSIDSADVTTWSGAWNTVLTWLLDNCPSAHIGVVIAYGMQDALVTSLISICEKFGVSYVKAYDPHEFFSVGHSTGIGTDQATKRKTLYTLDNTHPNELGYELMSTSFEQFIRRM
jgi:lysophospholipase L1-like esterase